MKNKSLLFAAVATLGLTAATMAQNVPNYVPTNGLVGWWPFNGNANDESGSGNNGTVNGATLTADRYGIIDKAYSFDGIDDNIELQQLSQNSNSMTISLWTSQIDSIIGGQLVTQSVYGTPPVDVSWVFEYLGNTPNHGPKAGSFKALYKTGCNNSYNDHWFNTLNIEAWNNITFIIEESGLAKIYLNSYPVTTSQLDSFNTCTPAAGTTLRFGGPWHILDQLYYQGNLDDIGIWNRALTQQEITDLFNANICYQSITVTDTLLINMGITGYNPVSYNNTIKIFPNPTNDHITINYGNFASLSGYQLKIQNSLGQQVFQTNITQQTDYLALATWGGNGLYFVHIIDAQGNTIDIRKIVLQ